MGTSIQDLSFDEINNTIKVSIGKLQSNSKKEYQVFKGYQLKNLNQTQKIIRWDKKDDVIIYVDNFERKTVKLNLSFGLEVINILENCSEVLGKTSIGYVEIPACKSEYFTFLLPIIYYVSLYHYLLTEPNNIHFFDIKEDSYIEELKQYKFKLSWNVGFF